MITEKNSTTRTHPHEHSQIWTKQCLVAKAKKTFWEAKNEQTEDNSLDSLRYSCGIRSLRAWIWWGVPPIQLTSGSRPPCPQDFFKIMQFSGNFKGRPPILSTFWAQGPPRVQTPLGHLTKILDLQQENFSSAENNLDSLLRIHFFLAGACLWHLWLVHLVSE